MLYAAATLRHIPAKIPQQASLSLGCSPKHFFTKLTTFLDNHFCYCDLNILPATYVFTEYKTEINQISYIS